MNKALKGSPVIFGEALFDRFPDGTRVLGGAPFNVAWHLHAFGANPLMISRVGKDPEGAEILDRMCSWGMRTKGIGVDDHLPTGAVAVSFSGDNEPQYDILPEQAYDHTSTAGLHLEEPVALIYHGTLALRHTNARQALENLQQNTTAPIFIDINLRDPWWSQESIETWLHNARWVKINEDELHQISRQSIDLEPTDLTHKANNLINHYGLDLLVVTQGAKGATAFRPNEAPATVAPVKSQKVADTVGAGDAFASVLLLGILRGWPLTETMEKAQRFASRIVAQHGATAFNHDLYEDIS